MTTRGDAEKWRRHQAEQLIAAVKPSRSFSELPELVRMIAMQEAHPSYHLVVAWHDGPLPIGVNARDRHLEAKVGRRLDSALTCIETGARALAWRFDDADAAQSIAAQLKSDGAHVARIFAAYVWLD